MWLKIGRCEIVIELVEKRCGIAILSRSSQEKRRRGEVPTYPGFEALMAAWFKQKSETSRQRLRRGSLYSVGKTTSGK
jgi:hypothetical protein